MKVISPENLARLVKLEEEKKLSPKTIRFLISIAHNDNISDSFLSESIKIYEKSLKDNNGKNLY